MLSAAILLHPTASREGLRKGAAVLSEVDEFVKVVPGLRDVFYLVERRAWAGVNVSRHADVKLIEDLPETEAAQRLAPHAITLPIAPADFIDTDQFRPFEVPRRIDALQISRWDAFKHHELFVRAASLLPERRFVLFGHFAERGTRSERAVKARVVAEARRIAPNLKLPFARARNNRPLTRDPRRICAVLNRARMGVLTSQLEGVNRFKMECLACGVPVLVRQDACWPLRKHVEDRTGVFYEPTPEGLAAAIRRVLAHAESFSTRSYVLEHSGMRRSLGVLESALNTLAGRGGHPPYFSRLRWTGRNESLLWGRQAVAALRNAVRDAERAHGQPAPS
jgi:glycosyltransferase involved in cell wall biosynthesis